MTLAYDADVPRENRTYFHIAHAYRVNASTAYRIMRHVEDVLSSDETFSLPSKRQLQASDLELSFVIVDVTETPIGLGEGIAALPTSSWSRRACF